MALTPAQWLEEFKGIIPAPFFEEEENQVAHLEALAALFSQAESDSEDHFDESMISRARGTFLDTHGSERRVRRLFAENDASYSERIRNFINQSNCPAIRSLVDKVLVAGVSRIVEDDGSELFFDRNTFLNRGSLLIEQIVNGFSIIVPKQLHEPYSFYNRENFIDREDFVGMFESSQDVFDRILEIGNENKACGFMYRIIEEL